MVYTITKKVNGYYYKYLVKSVREGKKVKQIHLKYLGKVKNLKPLPELILDKCACCGITKNLVIDHIKPLCKGGKNNKENLQILCPSCNRHKGNKTINYGKKININKCFISSEEREKLLKKIKKELSLNMTLNRFQDLKGILDKKPNYSKP